MPAKLKSSLPKSHSHKPSILFVEDMQVDHDNRKETLYKRTGGPRQNEEEEKSSLWSRVLCGSCLLHCSKRVYVCYIPVSEVFNDAEHVIKMQIIYEEIKWGNTLSFLKVNISFFLWDNYSCKITSCKCFDFLKLLLYLASKPKSTTAFKRSLSLCSKFIIFFWFSEMH